MYSISTYILVLRALSKEVSAKIGTLIKIRSDFVTIFDNTLYRAQKNLVSDLEVGKMSRKCEVTFQSRTQLQIDFENLENCVYGYVLASY